MATTAGSPQIVPESPPSAPALRAADAAVAAALESVLADNTRRVYAAQWGLFNDWCGDVGLRALPAEPLTVARYLAARAGSGATIAPIRLATSAISKAHEWAKLESPCRDPGVRASLKGWSRRLAKPQRQAAPSPRTCCLSSASLPSSPASAVVASRPPRRPPSAPASTWPCWRRCPTPASAAPRLHL